MAATRLNSLSVPPFSGSGTAAAPHASPPPVNIPFPLSIYIGGLVLQIHPPHALLLKPRRPPQARHQGDGLDSWDSVPLYYACLDGHTASVRVLLLVWVVRADAPSTDRSPQPQPLQALKFNWCSGQQFDRERASCWSVAHIALVRGSGFFPFSEEMHGSS